MQEPELGQAETSSGRGGKGKKLTRNSLAQTIESKEVGSSELVTAFQGKVIMTVAELTTALDKSEAQYLFDECEAFDKMLKAELHSFANIECARKRWETGLSAGTFHFIFEFDKEITNRYRNWVFKARICLQQLRFRKKRNVTQIRRKNFGNASKLLKKFC